MIIESNTKHLRKPTSKQVRELKRFFEKNYCKDNSTEKKKEETCF